MKRWMQGVAVQGIAVFVWVAACSPLSGAGRNSQGSSPQSVGSRFELWYLRPSVCNLQTTTEDPRSLEEIERNPFPVGNDVGIRPDYHLGYRYIAQACLGRGESFFSYGWLRGKESGEIVGSGLWPLLVSPEFSMFPLCDATIHQAYRLDYRTSDALYRIPLFSMCSVGLGVHYGKITERLNVEYKGELPPPLVDELGYVVVEARRKREAWGSGPQLEMRADFSTLQRLNLLLHFGGGVLIGERHSRIEERGHQGPHLQEMPIVSHARSGQGQRAVVPFVKGRVGASVTCPLGKSGWWVTELGYAFTAYWNALETVAFTTPQASCRTCDLVTFDGLYWILGLKF